MRFLLRLLGDLCVTVGGLLLLFVVWQGWWTDVQANATGEQVLEQVQQAYDIPPAPAAPNPGGDVDDATDGDRRRARR